jgi:hypothetical protein
VTLLALLALLVLVLSAFDFRHRPEGEPRLQTRVSDSGPLRSGAAEVAIAVPFPSTKAGYGPRDRVEAQRASSPILARALALEAGKVRFTLLEADLLEVDSKLLPELSTRLGASPGEIWLCASHAHSSLGNYDPNLLAQVAGTGSFHPAAREALLVALADAYARAWKAVEPVELEVGEGELEGVTVNRSDDEAPVDRQLVHVLLKGAANTTEVIRLAAHPTLATREEPALDGDYPEALAQLRSTSTPTPTPTPTSGPAPHPVFVLQGAVGDASINRERASAPEAFAKLVDAQLPATKRVEGNVSFSLTRATVPLPAAELEAAPSWARRAASNLIDPIAPRQAEISVLELGPLSVLAMPAEPTFASSEALLAPLRSQAKAGDVVTVLGLCNGYVGYVEPLETVKQGQGEAERTYFGPSLLDTLVRGASLVVQTSTPAAASVAPHPPDDLH